MDTHRSLPNPADDSRIAIGHDHWCLRCATLVRRPPCHGISFACRVLGSHREWPAEMWQLVVFVIEVKGYELYILQGRAAAKLGLLAVPFDNHGYPLMCVNPPQTHLDGFRMKR